MARDRFSSHLTPCKCGTHCHHSRREFPKMAGLACKEALAVLLATPQWRGAKVQNTKNAIIVTHPSGAVAKLYKDGTP